MIFIKRAQIFDAPVISFLGKQTFTETFASLFSKDELDGYLNATFNIRKLEESLSKNRNVFGILYYYDNPAGYYKVKIGMGYDNSFNEKYCQLQKIYILGDYLHLRLGKELLENILCLKEFGVCKCIWLTVLNTNYRAIKFYENHGFEKLKKCYYTIGVKRLEYELMIKSVPG